MIYTNNDVLYLNAVFTCKILQEVHNKFSHSSSSSTPIMRLYSFTLSMQPLHVKVYNTFSHSSSSVVVDVVVSYYLVDRKE
jgi:hypothetical protein